MKVCYPQITDKAVCEERSGEHRLRFTRLSFISYLYVIIIELALFEQQLSVKKYFVPLMEASIKIPTSFFVIKFNLFTCFPDR
jgi:hypothetical protein